MAKGNPGRGGAQPGAGRPKGSTTSAASQLRELIKEHVPKAIETIVKLLNSDNDGIKLAASKEILDRGIGRAPPAPVDAEGNPVENVVRIVGGLTEKT